MLFVLIVSLWLLTHLFVFMLGRYLRDRSPRVTWDEMTRAGAKLDFGPNTIGPIANDFDARWGQV